MASGQCQNECPLLMKIVAQLICQACYSVPIGNNQIQCVLIMMIESIQQTIQQSSEMQVPDSSLITINDKQSKGIDIAFKNVKYVVEAEDKSQKPGCLPCSQVYYQKEILKEVSGIFRAGEVSAIMGASGAGKTTLLNVLACRVNRSGLSGEVLANDLAYTYEDFGDFANYVMQQDVLLATMTVRETLEFAANLKINKPLAEKKQMIEELAKSLKLDGCLDTLVGGAKIKGISGGQKKRTSIAFELISDPAVLMLDEPTSGLDSLTSFVIVKYLKRVAQEQHKTIIMTIHQPNSDIFNEFDRLLLMVEGHIIYQGKASMAVEYFGRNFGLNCPEFVNPADYFMSIIHHESKENVDNYPKYFGSYSQEQSPHISKQIDGRERGTIERREISDSSFCYTLGILMKRDWNNGWRNPMIIISRFFQSIFISLFTAGVYYRFSGEYQEEQNWRALTGFLFFFSIGNIMMEVTPVSLVFPLERVVFLKEESSKFYTTLPYFLSRSIVELPYLAVMPLMMIVIAYWFVGLSNTAEQFFTAYLVAFLMSFCGNSLGLLIGSLVQDEKTIHNAVNIIILPLVIFAGFFKNRANLPVWVGWIEYISPLKYSFSAYIQNEVKFASSSRVDEFNLDVGIWTSVAVLAGMLVAYRILSLFFLWFNRTKLE